MLWEMTLSRATFTPLNCLNIIWHSARLVTIFIIAVVLKWPPTSLRDLLLKVTAVEQGETSQAKYGTLGNINSGSRWFYRKVLYSLERMHANK